MATKKLTDKFISGVKPPNLKAVEYWDSSVVGLGLRASPKGQKSWTIIYRINGKQKRLTFGKYPAISLSDARKMAGEKLRMVVQDIDPALTTPPPPQKETVQRVVRLFIKRYAKQHNKTWRTTEQILEREIFPVWGERAIQSITRRDVIVRIDSVMDRGKEYMANRLLAILRKFFNWCVERDIIQTSPASGLKPPGKERSRDRILTEEEVKSVWEASQSMGYPFGSIYLLLTITGQRLNEVASMKWEDLNLKENHWTIQADDNKPERLHVVPLSSLALNVIESVPRVAETGFLFSTTGITAVSGFGKAKNRLNQLSNVTDWKTHDLRRTATTFMAQLGVAPHVAEAVLNHSSGIVSGVAGVYNRYSYLKEKQDALDLWADKLEAIVKDEELQGAVTPFRQPN
jgi:integrase